MTQSAITAKLNALLTEGITSEAEALYLLVELRKLLEQQGCQEGLSLPSVSAPAPVR
jgi:hypothetical protein